MTPDRDSGLAPESKPNGHAAPAASAPDPTATASGPNLAKPGRVGTPDSELAAVFAPNLGPKAESTVEAGRAPERKDSLEAIARDAIESSAELISLVEAIHATTLADTGYAHRAAMRELAKLDSIRARLREETTREPRAPEGVAKGSPAHLKDIDSDGWLLLNDVGKEHLGAVYAENASLHARVADLETKALRLEGAVKQSMVALDDWLNTFASEFCDERRVQEAWDRIRDVGTVGYIADVQVINRKALDPES